jgi:hypothetical protein
MNHLRNDNGIALVTALMLTLLTLVIVMALMFFVENGIRMSAASKRYKNVRQAAFGGLSLTMNELMPLLENARFSNYSSGSQSGIQLLKNEYTNLNLNFQNPSCLHQKLGLTTSNWSAACSTTLDPKTAPDMTFTLQSTLSSYRNSNQGYIVYAKIVDTAVVGNTDPSDKLGLRKAENVNDSSSASAGKTIPTMYRMDIRAEMQQNPLEQANLSVVYAY